MFWGIPLTPQAIRKVGHRYRQGGIERALYEKERPGAAAVLDDGQKQRIIAIVCSDPPTARLDRTEAVLETYEQPYDPQEPLI
jgi:beta-phosphoglucomutase-like phosphatase (HAD superfamily)